MRPPKPYQSPLSPQQAAPAPNPMRPPAGPDDLTGPVRKGDLIGRRWVEQTPMPRPALCPLCLMDTVHAPGCERELAEQMLAEDPTLAQPEPAEPPPLSAQLTSLLGDALVRVGELLRARGTRRRRDDDRL